MIKICKLNQGKFPRPKYQDGIVHVLFRANRIVTNRALRFESLVKKKMEIQNNLRFKIIVYLTRRRKTKQNFKHNPEIKILHLHTNLCKNN